MYIRIENYREFPEGKVIGVAEITIMIENTALTINDVKVINNASGGTFYALPTKEYISKEGEKKYSPICGFFTKEGYKEFQDAIRTAFNEYFQRQQSSRPPVQQHSSAFETPSRQPQPNTQQTYTNNYQQQPPHSSPQSQPEDPFSSMPF